MADSTRYKAMEEQIKKSDLKMQELATELKKLMDNGINGVESTMEARLGQMESKMESRLEAYTASMESKLTSILKFLAKEKQVVGHTEGSVDRTPLLPTPGMPPKANQWDEMSGNPFMERGNKPYSPKLPRVELPMFAGVNPREWLRKVSNSSPYIRFRNPGEWR